ncbi:hypothetical protein [Cellulomonas cellasea]|uniref:Uncharacterized protein n=2 Tax=Cellulomonas cellasea TaxID=43670 RepID=A0A0A0BC75_9CELL|nr:hypothetical protein [Cellulomonas cellasea]KGM02931.1 hypothetical protein Q760_10595 [Cellulomonas cellasea DSM 20118]GEA89723.1 hypothetical protein CCE01nite_36720 [Cellulomonas cellasea]
MSESWDAEVFRVPDIAWQAEVPPARHPIPVQYAPDLGVGDELTIGLPGRYFIDGQLLARAEREVIALHGQADDLESLAVAAPYAFWLAKAYPRAGLTMQWWPIAYSWIYRDAVRPDEQRPDVATAARLNETESWLNHVRPTLDEPPVRRPTPARMAGSLSGRVVRMQHDRGLWSWWVAVSEPIDDGGDFLVHVVSPRNYWLSQVTFDPAVRQEAVSLHRLFTYE